MNCTILQLVSTRARIWVKSLTTPPPPNRDVFAAFTIDVTARSVMDVLMRVILELRAAEGWNWMLSWCAGRKLWRLYSCERVGMQASVTVWLAIFPARSILSKWWYRSFVMWTEWYPRALYTLWVVMLRIGDRRWGFNVKEKTGLSWRAVKLQAR